MSAIPEELIAEAREIADGFFAPSGAANQALTATIARALMAARKDERGRAVEAERTRVKAALSRYRAGLYDIPLGHENPQRGASTYNWKVSVYEEIAAAILSDKEQSHVE